MVEQFCKSILQIVTRNSKALANLVMGLASQNYSGSVVQVSLNACYHYQHSSINKVVDGLDEKLIRVRSSLLHQSYITFQYIGGSVHPNYLRNIDKYTRV